MKKPKISICIPTYNRADLIGVTLQCVANQTIRPDEVIVIDNASTDNTEEVVKRYKKYGINYIKNSKNIGMAGNLNKCVKLASNDLFTFLPSDDLIAPTWYEEWEIIVNKQKADLYTSPLTIINNEYKPIWTFCLYQNDEFIKQPNVLSDMAKHFAPGFPPSAASIFKKSVFKTIEKFDPMEGSECDVRPMTHLFDMCDIYYFDKPLFAFREHDMRSFDTKKEKRSESKIQKIDHYFSILQNIYKNRYKQNLKYRVFIQIHLFMTLANVNLYIIKGEFATIMEVYKRAHYYFPDLFKKFDDYSMFSRIQLEFIRRGLTMYRIPKEIKKQIQWIENIKSYLYE